MTPKEKAKELVEKFMSYSYFSDGNNSMNRQYQQEDNAKQCALIAVENEYNAKIQAYNEMSEFCLDVASQAAIYAEKEKEKVKQEIEKL